jgi:lathosterol oxidase
MTFPHDVATAALDFLAALLVLVLGSLLLYFTLAGASYFIFFVWKKERFFPGKTLPRHYVRKAIRLSLLCILGNAVITAPIAELIHRGHSQVYFAVDDHGWGYLVLSLVGLVAFTETLVYWIHRWLHHPVLYKALHKYHHEFREPTPWASMAFHPLDSFAQALPYHLFAFLFPIHVAVYVGCVVVVSLWTFLIHDQLTLFPWAFVNYSAHHTLHHTANKYNYGQFFTFWDRLAGTYRSPLTMAKRSSPRESKAVVAAKPPA